VRHKSRIAVGRRPAATKEESRHRRAIERRAEEDVTWDSPPGGSCRHFSNGEDLEIPARTKRFGAASKFEAQVLASQRGAISCGNCTFLPTGRKSRFAVRADEHVARFGHTSASGKRRLRMERQGAAMSQRKNRREPNLTPRRRVGTFHFLASRARQYRLLAALIDGRQIEIRKGPSIGHLWLEPVSIDPEIESLVVALRVERLTESPANNRQTTTSEKGTDFGFWILDFGFSGGCHSTPLTLVFGQKRAKRSIWGAMPTALRGHANQLDVRRHAHAEPWGMAPRKGLTA